MASFTNLTQDHLDFHSDMDDYARAKALLFERCDHGAVNLDDSYSKIMLDGAKCPMLSYSIDASSNLQAEKVVLEPSSVHFTAVYGEETEEISLAIPGRFSVYNATRRLRSKLLVTEEGCYLGENHTGQFMWSKE